MSFTTPFGLSLSLEMASWVVRLLGLQSCLWWWWWCRGPPGCGAHATLRCYEVNKLLQPESKPSVVCFCEEEPLELLHWMFWAARELQRFLQGRVPTLKGRLWLGV